MSVSSDYRNIFIYSDALTLKTKINSLTKEEKNCLINAAKNVMDDIIQDCEHGNQNSKEKYINLMAKFKEDFPEESEFINTTDRVAQQVFQSMQIKEDFHTLLQNVSNQVEHSILIKLVEKWLPDKIPESVESILNFVQSNYE